MENFKLSSSELLDNCQSPYCEKLIADAQFNTVPMSDSKDSTHTYKGTNDVLTGSIRDCLEFCSKHPVEATTLALGGLAIARPKAIVNWLDSIASRTKNRIGVYVEERLTSKQLEELLIPSKKFRDEFLDQANTILREMKEPSPLRKPQAKPGERNPFPDKPYPAPDKPYPAPDKPYPAPDKPYPAPDKPYPAPDKPYPTSGTK